MVELRSNFDELHNVIVYWRERNAPGDREEAAELLRQAHTAAERMGISEAVQIRGIQEKEGLKT